MSFTYTKHTLKKLETLFSELEYTIRYEKGNFQSGYCLVENKKIAIVNKFFETEGRINCLLEILNDLEVEEAKLGEKSAGLYRDIRKASQRTAQEEE